MISGRAGSVRVPFAAWKAPLCASLTLFAGIGLGRFGYAPFIPALVQDGWFTPGQADYLGAANLMGYVVGAVLTGRLAASASVPVLLRASMLIVALQFLACSSALGFAWFFGWRFAAGVAGAFLMVLGPPIAIERTPLAVRGKAGGLVFTGIGLGTALSGSALPRLVPAGLPIAWRTMSVVVFILTAACWRELRSFESTNVDGRTATSQASDFFEPRLPRMSIPLLIAAYSGYAIGFVPHTVFWVDFIARGLKQGLSIGGNYWVLLGLSAAVGPLMTGIIADRIGFAQSMRWCLLTNAVSVALPIFSERPWALALSSIGTGSMGIGIVSIAAGRVMELVPPWRQRQVWGWMIAAFSVAYAATAYLLSLLFVHTGSFRLLFGIGAVALLFSSGLSWLRPGSQDKAADIPVREARVGQLEAGE